MYGHGYPYQRPPYQPPPPQRPGLSPLAIVLIVLGVMFVLGAGACIFVGGLVWLGANAEAESPIGGDASAANAPLIATGATGAGTTPSSPVPPLGDGNGDGDDQPAGAQSPSGASAKSTANPTAPKAAGGKYFCNATGWVRVCGFANVCSNQMVSGMGVGPDQYQASQMARTACQGMAIAKGGSAICTVTCSHK